VAGLPEQLQFQIIIISRVLAIPGPKIEARPKVMIIILKLFFDKKKKWLSRTKKQNK
jgi:hypothetical protein